MATEMTHTGNNWFHCPRCGKMKRYTTTATGFFYTMGKYQNNIRMTCPCEEREAEAERGAKPKRFISEKLPSGWHQVYDREACITVNDKLLTMAEAARMAEELNDGR